MFKICAISDLHGTLPTIEECDVLFICGDIFPLAIETQLDKCREWFLNKFCEWVKDVPSKSIYMIAGNHDFAFETWGYDNIMEMIEEKPALHGKLIYVEDSLIEIENGLTLYGCPWCISPKGFAFIDSSGKFYEQIPDDCDILLVHQPPRIGKLGCSYPDTSYETNYGSESLANVIADKHIKYVFCGHIHSGIHGGIYANGVEESGKPLYAETLYYNVSIKDEEYKVRYEPTYVII